MIVSSQIVLPLTIAHQRTDEERDSISKELVVVQHLFLQNNLLAKDINEWKN